MHRHLLLFDLNGTLCSKTRDRYATKGGHYVKYRPHVKETLRVLSEYYDLGIYSSATYVSLSLSLSLSLYVKMMILYTFYI